MSAEKRRDRVSVVGLMERRLVQRVDHDHVQTPAADQSGLVELGQRLEDPVDERPRRVQHALTDPQQSVQSGPRQEEVTVWCQGRGTNQVCRQTVYELRHCTGDVVVQLTVVVGDHARRQTPQWLVRQCR